MDTTLDGNNVMEPVGPIDVVGVMHWIQHCDVQITSTITTHKPRLQHYCVTMPVSWLQARRTNRDYIQHEMTLSHDS